ncbi:MAG: hypothetical protein IJO09_00180 [Oscillospiraceae bacterium]|nr:hypothetical protein [Oscillospiraceae bacterium]
MKLLSYLTLVACYLFSNFMSIGFNQMYYEGRLAIAIVVILCISTSVGFAILGFYASNKFVVSDEGLRYKVISIFAMFIGVISGIGQFTSIFPNVELFEALMDSQMALALFLSLINSAFVFGICLFVVFKMKYKKQEKVKIKNNHL